MSARARTCRGLALGLAAVSVFAAGCGGSATKRQADGATVPNGSSTSKNGRLTEVPGPLRLSDLRREKTGSARAAVLRLLYFAQWGSAPNIAAAYDPEVRARIGVSNIVGTYSQQRALLSTSRARFLESIETSTGMFIAVDLLRADAAPAHHSFSLRRRLGRWVVVYDTMIESGLSAYVAGTHSRAAAGQPPDTAAARRGRQAAHAYRRLFAVAFDRSP